MVRGTDRTMPCRESAGQSYARALHRPLGTLPHHRPLHRPSPQRPLHRARKCRISSRRRPPARPAGAPPPGSSEQGGPVVGQREPCPCGSGRRYKTCHGQADRAFVGRPFAGLPDESEWVALREVVPSATAALTVRGHEDRDVLLSTVLPRAWPAWVRGDRRVLLGLQVPNRSGDPSRDLADALLRALDAAPGPVLAPGLPGPGPRLQDLLAPEPLDVRLHVDFAHWAQGLAELPDEVAAARERADAAAVPTARLVGVRSAYWCRLGERASLRWALPEDEEPLLDALARVSAAHGLAVGPDTRFLGSFRAHGLLVPVWDLPPDLAAPALEEPAAALRARLDEALASPRALTAGERRLRAGLLGTQLTVR